MTANKPTRFTIRTTKQGPYIAALIKAKESDSFAKTIGTLKMTPNQFRNFKQAILPPIQDLEEIQMDLLETRDFDSELDLERQLERLERALFLLKDFRVRIEED